MDSARAGRDRDGAQAHFAPGAGWSYSGTGYIVLGLIVEKASGHSLAGELLGHGLARISRTAAIAIRQSGDSGRRDRDVVRKSRLAQKEVHR